MTFILFYITAIVCSRIPEKPVSYRQDSELERSPSLVDLLDPFQANILDDRGLDVYNPPDMDQSLDKTAENVLDNPFLNQDDTPYVYGAESLPQYYTSQETYHSPLDASYYEDTSAQTHQNEYLTPDSDYVTPNLQPASYEQTYHESAPTNSLFSYLDNTQYLSLDPPLSDHNQSERYPRTTLDLVYEHPPFQNDDQAATTQSEDPYNYGLEHTESDYNGSQTFQTQQYYNYQPYTPTSHGQNYTPLEPIPNAYAEQPLLLTEPGRYLDSPVYYPEQSANLTDPIHPPLREPEPTLQTRIKRGKNRPNICPPLRTTLDEFQTTKTRRNQLDTLDPNTSTKQTVHHHPSANTTNDHSWSEYIPQPSTSKHVQDDFSSDSESDSFISSAQYESECSFDLLSFTKQTGYYNKVELDTFIGRLFEIDTKTINYTKGLNIIVLQNTIDSSISVLRNIVDIMANVCAFKGLSTDIYSYFSNLKTYDMFAKALSQVKSLIVDGSNSSTHQSTENIVTQTVRLNSENEFFSPYSITFKENSFIYLLSLPIQDILNELFVCLQLEDDSNIIGVILNLFWKFPSQGEDKTEFKKLLIRMIASLRFERFKSQSDVICLNEITLDNTLSDYLFCYLKGSSGSAYLGRHTNWCEQFERDTSTIIPHNRSFTLFMALVFKNMRRNSSPFESLKKLFTGKVSKAEKKIHSSVLNLLNKCIKTAYELGTSLTTQFSGSRTDQSVRLLRFEYE